MTNHTVLVTGAAGLLGAEVTYRLATAGHAVVALTHRATDLIRNDGAGIRAAHWPPRPGTVVRLTGDVTVDRLDLPTDRYAALASAVDTVVHCAAITGFGLPERAYHTVNVTGTTHVLALATTASARLVHVSTAYVCGERDGVAGEDELDVGQRFGNPYEHSKLRAEQLVRAATADGLPAVVIRPSIVAGAQRSGVIRGFNNLYPLVKLATEGTLRTLPGHYDAVLDLVPVDRVTRIVTDAVDRFESVAGATCHATGHALTLRDFSDVLAEYPSFRVPRFVPPGEFDPAVLPDRERRYYQRVGTLYTSYFRRRLRFDDSVTRQLLGWQPATGGRAYLRRLLDHCLRAGYLGGMPTPTAVAGA
jgi:thioester reductase-like protein